MTTNAWLNELRRYIVNDLENIDDSIIIELRMLELYLDFNDHLPEGEELLGRLSNIVELYTAAIDNGDLNAFPNDPR